MLIILGIAAVMFIGYCVGNFVSMVTLGTPVNSNTIIFIGGFFTLVYSLIIVAGAGYWLRWLVKGK